MFGERDLRACIHIPTCDTVSPIPKLRRPIKEVYDFGVGEQPC